MITVAELCAPVFPGGPRLDVPRWLRRFHDRDLARAALVASEVRAVMVIRPSGSARSKAYRQQGFQRKYGISYNMGRRLARAQGLSSGSPARAVELAGSSALGVELVERGRRPGASLKDQALGDAAAQAIAYRGRLFNARNDVASGRRTVGEAERRYDLGKGTLRRSFSADELIGATDQGVVLQVIGKEGVVLAPVSSQAERQLLGAHWHGVERALKGDPDALRRFRGLEVGGVRLADDRDLASLRAWWAAGLLDGGPYPEFGGVAA